MIFGAAIHILLKASSTQKPALARIVLDQHQLNNDQWVAKINGRELWRYPARGKPIVGKDGLIFLNTGRGFLVVDRKSAEIRGKLPSLSLDDPRVILSKDQVLVFENGVWPVTNLKDVVEHPRSIALWLRDLRAVNVYDSHSMGVLWSSRETEVGLPVKLTGNRLYTIGLTNLEETLLHVLDHRTTPRFELTALNARTGDVLSKADFALEGNRGWTLASYLFSSSAPGEPRISATGKRVRIFNLFGKNFSGKRYRNHVK